MVALVARRVKPPATITIIPLNISTPACLPSNFSRDVDTEAPAWLRGPEHYNSWRAGTAQWLKQRVAGWLRGSESAGPVAATAGARHSHDTLRRPADGSTNSAPPEMPSPFPYHFPD
ncbi:hypothetical protein E2C01_092339 [Portunus trituberculatus]|uniref:Uncharacterized protein n=1 Tax=Portunus trituberculatus TaxID=210409 RepID=A0A5B7JG81_PORTR|nr:hypothetical protein [Portunus trituberculatus]